MNDFPILAAAAGSASAIIAAIAWLGDRRRMRRRNPDAVGFMPWTGLFLLALLGAVLLLGLAVRAWLAS